MPSQYSWRQMREALKSFAQPVIHGGAEANNPRYCYAVWLRHLVTLHGLGLPLPTRVVELGPGQSMGVGFAAVLSGVSSYVGLDIAPIRQPDDELFDSIAQLFRDHTNIPSDEFPNVQPCLGEYRFPSHLIRAAQPISAVSYHAPWHDVPPTGDADLVLSQAVMLLVPNIRDTYARLAAWLKPGGVMSHALNVTSLGLTRDWDGHRQITALEWRLLQGRKPYTINRAALPEHLAAMREAGCAIVSTVGDERRSVVVAQKHQ